MRLKSVTIKNLKCFKESGKIELAQPNGDLGSGLTILIGENGNGKTTILEAINYLTQNKFTTQNKLSINDFRDFKSEIEVEAILSDAVNCKSSIDFYRDWNFSIQGLKFSAKSRTTKSRGKLLSEPFEVKTHFLPSGNYIKPSGEQNKDVDSRDLIFNNEQVIDDALNIFYFDKNRVRQIGTGNYKTTLERILDDLNWKFLKNLSPDQEDEMLKNISGAYFKQVEKVIGGSPGAKLGVALKDFFEKDEYEKLRLDLLNLLHPFTNSEFMIREEHELTQKSINNLGSGVEMVMAILLLRIFAKSSDGSIIYLIDEPEIHLHPKAQEKLLKLLLEEARNQQIVISTHSPYMFKGVFSSNAKLLLCKRNQSNEVEIEDARCSGWGLFAQNSPTWGEINYFAYNLPTIEFHNELYGYIQTLAIDEDEKNSDENEFDKYLQTMLGDKKSVKTWIKILKHKDDNGNLRTRSCERTLQTFIRNSIHHPENNLNHPYSTIELDRSIKEMIVILRSVS